MVTLNNSIGRLLMLMAGFLFLFTLPLVSAADSIVSYWTFNDTLNDFYGINNGSMVSGVATYVNATSGNGVLFDGTRWVNASKNFGTLKTPTFSVVFWVNFTSFTGTNTVVSTQQANKGYTFQGDVVGSKLGLWVGNDTSFARAEGGVLNPNVFYFIVGTYDGTSIKYYVNGVLNATASISGYVNSTTDFGIGASNDGSLGINGVVDEVKYYNYSLTAGEILNLYNNINYLVSYNATTYETSSENFYFNMTGDGTNMSAVLNYGGTNYTATNSGNLTYGVFNSTVQIPASPSTKTFFWFYNNGTSSQTTNYTQTINPLIFSICNSTLAPRYINFTFKDEDTSNYVNGSLTSSFTYYLGDGSVTKSYSYQNTTDQFSYAFCTNANTSTLYATPSLQYSNYESIIRTYNYASPLTLTNAGTNKVLYLLKTANGIYSSYQTVTQSLSIIPNALVTFTNGVNVIESKLTDSSGIATFFLNPNNPYNLTASKSGYVTYTATIYPTQTSYTITLLSTSSGNITSYNHGVNYTINPVSSYLSNQTTYNFNATLFSSYLTLDSWGFNISNGSINLTSVTGTGGLGNLGNINVNFNTGNYTTLNLNLWWTYNGTTSYATRTYTVETLSGTGWSLSNSIVDLKSYIGSGFFGLTPTGLNIIIFLVIFITTGVLSYKFGIASPAAMSGILFVLVLIFDVVLGLVYYDSTIFVNKVPHVATMITGLITLALVIKEGASY